jgi:thiamine transporter
MPFGGNFLGISMIPMVLIGFLFGLKFGLLGGFIYGIIEIMLAPSGYIIGWSFLLDYLLGFTAYGLTGLFISKYENPKYIVLGVLIAGFVRYISLSFAGVIFWSEVINADAFVYSFFVYNPWYNLSTTLITMIVLLALRKRLPIILQTV